MNFKNKIVWITGASSGVGEALVYKFHEQGAIIIISARRESELERVKKNCNKTTQEVFILPINLENHDELIAKAKIAINKFGKIDILFNNGGISQRSLVKDTIIDVDKRLMNVNYFGTIILTKAVLPSMLENKSGHIVVMSSLAGKFGTPLRSAYSAAKHALHGFFDSLRAEVYKENICVTIICSGYIKTNIAINALTDNGLPQNQTDKGIENGMLPEKFAEKALKAIYNKNQELLLGGKEKLGVYLKRFFPKLFSKIIRKQDVR